MEIILNIDTNLLLWLQNNIRTDSLDAIFKAVTLLTDRGLIWIIIGIILVIIKKTRQIGLYILVSLLISSILVNNILKPLFQRPRPCDIMIIEMVINRPQGFSFPSGHSASAFAAATAGFIKNKRLGSFMIIAAAVTAFSRLYLFVHYPSDVLAGIIIGIISAFLALIPFKYFKAKAEIQRGWFYGYRKL